MTNKNYQQLARDFLDLWQKQMSSVVRDKQFIQAMLDMTQSMQDIGDDGKRHASPSSGAAHAADALPGDLAGLAFRLAMCERRLAALEAASKPAAKRRAGGSRRQGSKKPRQ